MSRGITGEPQASGGTASMLLPIDGGKARNGNKPQAGGALSIDQLSIGLAPLLERELPTPEWAMKPFVQLGSSSLLYGPTGSGKTFVSMTIAAHIAAGRGWFHFETPSPRRVLYIDGEMGVRKMANRMGQITKCWTEQAAPNFKIISPDMGLIGLDSPFAAEGCINLSAPSTVATLEPALNWAEVVIVDNLMTLNHGQGSKNGSEAWEIYKQFERRLRNLGKGVLAVHHAGKQGDYLGSSMVALDTVEVIACRPDEAFNAQSSDDRSRLNVTLEKGRDLRRSEKRPFSLEWESTRENGCTWTLLGGDSEPLSKTQQITQYIALNPGKSITEIQKATNASRGMISKVKGELKAKSEALASA